VPDTLVIHEIYHSIQGESSWAGMPCVFVRLSACDLRCGWCDTAHAFTGGEPLAVGQVLDRVRGHGCRLVEITGGEPLLQPAVLPLIRRLCDDGFTVLLETSGAADVAPVDPRAIKIMDLKCPGSGECSRNRWENLGHLGPRDEVKFVIADRADYDWARQQVATRRLAERHTVLFAPVWQRLELRQLAEWILADSLPVRLQPQWHKYIWEPGTRGV